MFICKDCLPKESKWLVDLKTFATWGHCDNCDKTTVCVDCIVKKRKTVLIVLKNSWTPIVKIK